MKRWVVRFLLTMTMLMLPNWVKADAITPDAIADALNTLWVLIAAFLVFFMQAGFGFLEAGFVRTKNVVNIMAENFLDTTMTTIGFYAIGFGLMFGAGNGLIGNEWFFLRGLPETVNGISGYAFFFFQFAFSAAAATIASGIMAERTDFRADLIYSFFVGAFIYPVVGHWIWNSGGWLMKLGMVDFAGSTVVHLTGALTGLAGTLVLGKRIDKKFGKNIRGHNIALAALGTFILWLGWFGFNGGSALSAMNPSLLSLIVLNTDFAATTGAIVAIGLSYAFTKKWDVSMAFNGALGGLVAITAGCAAVTPPASLVIGALAGGLCYFGVNWFERLKIDDPVGGFAVHGMCGAFGTLAVGIWSVQTGLLHGGGLNQLGIQLLGIGAAVVFVFPLAYLMFRLINRFVGLRVSTDVEQQGLDKSLHGMESYPEFMLP